MTNDPRSNMERFTEEASEDTNKAVPESDLPVETPGSLDAEIEAPSFAAAEVDGPDVTADWPGLPNLAQAAEDTSENSDTPPLTASSPVDGNNQQPPPLPDDYDEADDGPAYKETFDIGYLLQHMLDEFIIEYPQVSVGLAQCFSKLRDDVNNELERDEFDFIRLRNRLEASIAGIKLMVDMKDWIEDDKFPNIAQLRFKLSYKLIQLNRIYNAGCITWSPVDPLSVSVGSVLRPFLYHGLKAELTEESREAVRDCITNGQNQVNTSHRLGSPPSPNFSFQDISLDSDTLEQIRTWATTFSVGTKGVTYGNIPEEDMLVENIHFAISNNELDKAQAYYADLKTLTAGKPAFAFNRNRLADMAHKKALEIFRETKNHREAIKATVLASNVLFDGLESVEGPQKGARLANLATVLSDQALLRTEGFGIGLDLPARRDLSQAIDHMKHATVMDGQSDETIKDQQRQNGWLRGHKGILFAMRAKVYGTLLSVVMIAGYPGLVKNDELIEREIAKAENAQQLKQAEELKHANKLYAEAEKTALSKDYKGALKKLEVLIAIKSADSRLNSRINYLKGMLHFKLNQHALAIAPLEASYKNRPARYKALADCYLQQMNLEKAYANLAQYFRSNGDEKGAAFL